MVRRHPKPTAEQNAGRLIRKAADIIEDRGWVQYSYGDAKQGFCAVGAIDFATTGRVTTKLPFPAQTEAACEILKNWLASHIDGALQQRHVEEWNDAPSINEEMVIQTMRKAADDLDPQSW